MKIFILTWMLVFGFMQSASAINTCKYDSVITGGDSNPWPWGKEVRFPWLSLQGVWVPGDGSCNSLFLFKAQTNQGQNRIIHIMQYDPSTCEKLAWGAGLEADKVLYASMVTKEGKSFDLTVRAFDEATIPSALASSPLAENVVVMSMYPKGDWERRMSYQMQKVTDVPVVLCDTNLPVLSRKPAVRR